MRQDAPLPTGTSSEALREDPEAAALLEALWEAAVPLAIVDRGGAFEKVNGALAGLTGLPVAQHVGRSVVESLLPVGGAFEAAIEAALSTGNATAGLHVALQTAGGRRTFSLSVNPVRSGGAITSAAIVLAGVAGDRADSGGRPTPISTPRLGATSTSAIAQERDLYAALFRQLPVGVVLRTSESGEPMGNDRSLRMLGGLASTPFRSDGSAYGPGETPIARAFRGETVQGEEAIYRRDDGEPVHLRVSAQPIHASDGSILAGAGVLEDVTVRRRLEEERGKLTSLLESTSDLIGVAGLDGRPLYMNEAGRRLVGLGSLEEGLSHPLKSFLHESERRRVFAEILPEVVAGRRFRGEVLLRHFATGEAIPAEVVAFAIAGRDGKPTALAAVGRDVRERRREEAERQRLVGELEGKQRLLDAVLQQMPAGVLVAGAPDGKLIFSNEQAEQILRRALIPVEAGASARMSIGLGPGDAQSDPEDWPLSRALRGEAVVGQEVEVVRGDGTTAELRCNAAPLRDGSGQVFAAIVVFDDVTEERSAARALLESEARFRRLAESGMIGVLVVEGDLVTDANATFLSLVGRSRDEVLRGLRWSDVAAKDHADRDRRGREQIRSQGFCKPFERDFLHQDGSRVPGVVGAALLENDRKAWVLFVLDDRERRRAEELQRQLMGIVSHDLRSPLTAMVMSASQLLYADDVPERHVKTAARIHKSAEKMRRLVNDLLDYQQARVGRGIPIQRRPADLGRLCGEVAQELELLHPARGLVYEPGTDGSGNFDADRVAQVLQNLLGNAFAHGPEGAEVRLSWTAEETTLRIEVHNGGPPIPESFLPLLFQPFRRGRPSPDGSSGFGLGLFIVHEIVRAHGGSIAVKSTEADGTTFTVRLPRG